MVLPPNRIGAVRGPNGSTLDDVVAALNALSVVVGDSNVLLASQQAFLSSITGFLTRLMGNSDPEGWPGITTMIGVQDEFVGQTLNQNAGNSVILLNLIFGALGTSGNVSFIRQVRDILTNIQGGTGNDLGDIIAGINAVQSASLATNQVLGAVSDTPLGSTIKDLLRSIDVNQLRAADCCEENSNQEPPTETEPPGPEDSCPLSGGPLRTTGYFFWRNLPAEELDEYIPLWDGLEAASSGLVAPLNSLDAAPIPAIYAPEFLANVCFEWNLLDGQVPGQLAQYRSSSTGEFVGETPTLISVTIGGGSSSVYLLDPEDRPRVFTVRVAEGSGAPTHNNYWLRWEANPV